MRPSLGRSLERDIKSTGHFLPSPLSTRAKMHISTNVRTLCSRVQTLIRVRRRKEKHHRESMQISEPYDLKREPVSLPGISEDEIAVLRDKAAASRIGVADPAMPLPQAPRSPYSTSSLFSHPFRPPAALPTLSPQASTSTESLP